MSEVTELLFHMHEETEEEAYQDNYLGMLEERRSRIIEQVNAFFRPIGEYGVVSVHDPSLPQNWYRGSKFFYPPIYVGAIKFFDLNKFLYICGQ